MKRSSLQGESKPKPANPAAAVRGPALLPCMKSQTYQTAAPSLRRALLWGVVAPVHPECAAPRLRQKTRWPETPRLTDRARQIPPGLSSSHPAPDGCHGSPPAPRPIPLRPKSYFLPNPAKNWPCPALPPGSPPAAPGSLLTGGLPLGRKWRLCSPVGSALKCSPRRRGKVRRTWEWPRLFLCCERSV